MRNNIFIWVTVVILLFLSMIVALAFGAADVTYNEAWHAVTMTATSETITMLQELRIPRVIGAIAVGAALALSGAMMQGVTRNPLADPGLLGVTAGANAALALTMAFFPSGNYIIITLACFVGAAVGTILVVLVGSLAPSGFSSIRIVLAGAAISAFLYAIADGVSIAFKISKDVSMWTAGGLIGLNWTQLQIALPFVIICIVLSLFLSNQLSILRMSEDVAVGLGQNVVLIKVAIYTLITILAGTAVALVGNLAFVGLMVPHIARKFIGSDYKKILPMSVLLGGIFMVLADLVGRTINAPFETPVAAIVSVLGLPFFLLIVYKGVKAS